VLEAEDQIVSVAHDDHVSHGSALTPLRGPEVDDGVGAGSDEAARL
jgi:hypothetical protein